MLEKGMEPQSCVICHQPLPQNSKLTVASVPREEADRNEWTRHENSDGMVMVNMCLQCQIARSKTRTNQELNAALMRNYGSLEKS